MAHSVRDLLEKRWGARFTPEINPITDTVGTTAVQILKQNPRRVGFLVVNLSLNNMFLRPAVAPTSMIGIRLDANGGSFSANWEEDGELVAWEWFIIADGAASPVFTVQNVIAPEG